VALIPFKLNTLTRAVDPVKLYEYFSGGKPVVATMMKEVERCASLVYTASDPEEFALQIDRALKESDPQLRAQRINFARANTWAARVEQIDRAVSASYPLVSILIVTYNCDEFIGPCLDSVARNTSWPNYEVIVIDNQSTDGSAEVAAERAASDPRIRFIRHDSNAGFAAANNIAARFAHGDYLLFLNPDTIVTPGWVGRLVRHFERSSAIGAVAAVTNFSGNETKINTDYRDVLEMQNFASELAVKHDGEARNIDMAALYCVLVSKAVWETVGQLDEGFEVGTFEDDDFSLRIRNAGYRVIAAEDCFIHHFGNGSFAKLPSKESMRIFEHNRQRFERKWQTVWKPHQLRPGVRSPHDEPRLTLEEFLAISGDALQREPEPIVLRRLIPANTKAGEVFNPQTEGNAAIVVECANATPTTVICFGSTTLPTSYGNANMLSGLVPHTLYSKAGRYPVRLVNDFGESNLLDFEVQSR
jgi:GT2 family glycosyltransferase